MLLQTVPCESCACMADEEGGTSACAGTRRAAVKLAVIEPFGLLCRTPRAVGLLRAAARCAGARVSTSASHYRAVKPR